MVQVHQDYIGKCTPERLAEIVDLFNILLDAFKAQGITKVFTYSRKCDKKMLHYWRILGFTNVYELDGVTYSYREI